MPGLFSKIAQFEKEPSRSTVPLPAQLGPLHVFIMHVFIMHVFIKYYNLGQFCKYVRMLLSRWMDGEE